MLYKELYVWKYVIYDKYYVTCVLMWLCLRVCDYLLVDVRIGMFVQARVCVCVCVCMCVQARMDVWEKEYKSSLICECFWEHSAHTRRTSAGTSIPTPPPTQPARTRTNKATERKSVHKFNLSERGAKPEGHH